MLNFHQLLNMKLTLLSVFVGSLVFTTGCLSSSEEWRGHANNAAFGGITPEPAVVMGAPARPAHPADLNAR
jgi:hypothetical protein